MSSTSSSSPSPLRIFPHRQQHEWDCGPATVYSLLVTLGARRLLYSHVLHYFAPCETHVWTIDLLIMMRAFGLRGMGFRSIAIPKAEATAASPVAPTSASSDTSASSASSATTVAAIAAEGWMAKYAALPFYASDMHHNEEQRVTRAFAYAREGGLDVQQRHVALEELVSKLQAQHWAIVLVNAHQLQCKLCESKLLQQKMKKSQSDSTTTESSTAIASNLPPLSVPESDPEPSPPFTGHFILLHHYDATTREFHYMNPGAVATHSHSCVISSEVFEAARCAPGTDEDLILFDLQANRNVVPTVQHPTAVSVEGPVSMEQLKQWSNTLPLSLATRSSSSAQPKQ